MDKIPMELLAWNKIKIPVIAGSIVLVIIVLIIMKINAPMDERELVNAYVTAISKGNCDRAYEMIDRDVKKYFPSYETPEDFKKSICLLSSQRYDELTVFSIDDEILGEEKSSIYFRLKFRTTWMPRPEFRSMKFDLRKRNGRWYIQGPFLKL